MKKYCWMLLLQTGAVMLATDSLSAQNSVGVVNDTVTAALGVRMDKEGLPYQVQQIKGEELTRVKDANFLQSLIGRVAGVSVNPSSAGAGAGVRVRMRGARSVAGNNNVLYVIDGIPFPQLAIQVNSSEFTGYGLTADAIASLNAEDIEEVSVLTGSAAAALYGGDASNGAILITTKKGSSMRRPEIHVSNSTTFNRPLVLPEFQNQYTQWSEDAASAIPWWNPADIYQTGYTVQNHIGISAGSEVSQSYFSAATQSVAGLIENNTVGRYNFTFRNSTHLLNNKLHIDLSLMYMHGKERNMLSHGEYANPIPPIYLIPECLDFSPNQYGDVVGIPLYERYDPDRGYNCQYWPFARWQNPFWIINRNTFRNKKDRFLGGLGINYEITDWLSASARVRYDKDVERQTQELYASTSYYLASSENGWYGERKADLQQTYADFSLDFHRKIGSFSLNALLGAGVRHREYDFDLTSGGLIQPNAFAIDNIEENSNANFSDSFSDDGKSAFASLQVGYKELLYLHATGRKEWNTYSRGETEVDANGFYPSVGVAFVPTAFRAFRSDKLSFLKLRFDYSEMGNSSSYILLEGVYSPSGTTSKPCLRQGEIPTDKTRMYEAGVDLGLFQNRLRMGLTWYNSSTQSSLGSWAQLGGDSHAIADVQNRGVEVVIGVTLPLGAVKWNSSLNFTKNKNEIKSLTVWKNGSNQESSLELQSVKVMNYQYGVEERLAVGGSIGDIYASSYQTDDKGNPVFLPDGSLAENPDYQCVGNTSPDFMMGWANDFSWKGLELGFVIQGSFGGKAVSLTQQKMDVSIQ